MSSIKNGAQPARTVDREKATAELYARWTEPIRYLSLAHGAALAVSVSALKDFKGAKHIGQVAGWFAVGFAMAVIGYVIIIMHRENTLGSYNVELQRRPSDVVHARILLVGIAFVALSAVILIFNIVIVACRVWSL
jgi:hypothetical protein